MRAIHDRCALIALAAALALGALTSTSGLRAGLSESQDHLHGRLRSGRRHRHDRAGGRAGAHRAVRLSDRDREPSRRGLQYRGACGRQRGAATAIRCSSPATAWRSTRPITRIPAIRPTSSRRSRSWRATAWRLAVNADNPARTLAEFVDRSKSKPFSFGFGGSSARIGSEYVFKVLLKTSSRGRAVPERRAGHERASGQPRRHHRGPDRGNFSAGAAGQDACARGHRRATLARLHGGSDLERIRTSRNRHQWVEWFLRARQNSI